MARSDAWKKKRRQEHLETRKHRYCIFTEGEKTEPQYFQAFKRLIENSPIYKNMVLIETIPCQADTLYVVEDSEK